MCRALLQKSPDIPSSYVCQYLRIIVCVDTIRKLSNLFGAHTKIALSV